MTRPLPTLLQEPVPAETEYPLLPVPHWAVTLLTPL